MDIVHSINVLNDSHELYQWCVKTFGISKCEYNPDGVWKRYDCTQFSVTRYVFDNESDLVLFKMVNGYNDNR